MPARRIVISPQGGGLAIVNNPLPGANVGVAYGTSLTAVGGNGSFTWSIVSQTGGNGWAINASTGSLTGTPIGAESDTLTIRVQDSSSPVQSAYQSFNLTVTNPAAAVTFSPAPGPYPGNVFVTLACATPASSIYYTINGGVPVVGQPGTTLYTGAFNLANIGTDIIQAIAIAPGFAQSAVSSGTYTVTAVGAIFPLLSAILYGESGANGYSTNVAKIAKMNSVVTQGWPGWRDAVSGKDLAGIYALWKAANPNLKILQYIVYEAYFPKTLFAGDYSSDPPSSIWYEACRQIQLGKWFAYTNGATKAGTPVPSNFGYPNYPEFNWTIYGAIYAGKTFVQWLSDFYKRVFKDGGNALISNGSNTLTQSANPNIDGFMTDNQFWQYRIEIADYNCDGSVDTPHTNTTFQTQCRHGNRVMVDYLRSIWPGVQIVGNCDVSNAVSQGVTDMSGTPDWYQAYDGSLNESTFGQPFSYETFGSFKDAMQTYITTQNMLRSGGFTVVMSDFLLSKGYALQRYALTYTLMNNGHHFADDGNNYSTVGMIMLDEYNFSLGTAIDPPQTSAKYSFNVIDWSGIWVREFQFGYAICAARRGSGGLDAYTLSGDQTTPYASFTLPVDVWRLRGTQDSTTNNATKIPAGTAISLHPRDGLILSNSVT